MSWRREGELAVTLENFNDAFVLVALAFPFALEAYHMPRLPISFHLGTDKHDAGLTGYGIPNIGGSCVDLLTD
jgi:hypothetical protein